MKENKRKTDHKQNKSIFCGKSDYMELKKS